MADPTVVPFVFEDKDPLRAIIKDGEPWFVASDACRVIGIADVSDAVAKLDQDEADRASIPSSGQNREHLIVSESGLYALVLRSRDAMTAGSPAHRFRRWVTGEVLPSIRRSGTYGRAVEPGFRDKVFAVEKTERIFGTEAAKEMWFHLRLPVTPSMRAQRSLFPRPGEGGEP
jgi:prophage antirepressor-like protein